MAVKINPVETGASQCPVDHTMFSRQKSRPADYPTGRSAVEQDADGVWHIHGFEAGRDLLRSSLTRQDGFSADQVRRGQALGNMSNTPVLYMDGEPHHEQRKRTARFFTPNTVSAKYRDFMERYADRLLAPLAAGKTVDLSRISMDLAVQVAARVVGLTNSRLPGMDRRLEMFFHHQNPAPKPGLWHRLVSLYSQRDMLSFFFIDVQPAIKARRKTAADDIISYLIGQGYSDAEILTEVVTFAAAGMVTTREFIAMAAWHLMETPALLERYRAAGEKERYAILHETLRLEPVVAELRRVAVADITLQNEGQSVVIPAGSQVFVDLYGTNLDESAAGEAPEMLCPGRDILAEGAQPMLLSFGDGYHRCPGAYLAIQESDIFLQKLFALPGLHIVRPPTLYRGELTQGYELREFMVSRG